MTGTVTIKPDKNEQRLIFMQYLKVGAVIIINTVLFNYVLRWILLLVCALAGGGFDSYESFRESAGRVLANDDISTVFSCFIPIISEVISITLGIKLLKLDFKPLFTRNGFTGRELLRDTTVSLGLQTLAGLLAALVGFILGLFNLESATADITAKNNSAWSLIFMYFYACLLGPLLEELLYRGIILQGMKKYNERFAIILSALIFGLMHQNYQQFILAFMIGLVFAAVDLKAGSLIPSIVMHIIVNTSGVLMQTALQATDFSAFQSVLSGEVSDTVSGSTAFMALAVLNAVFRFGIMFTGIVLLIVVAARGNSVRKPTPAGKSRGLPQLLRNPIWYVIFAGYFYLCFIEPMTPIK